MDGKCAALLVEIDEGWDATNTQFRAYINGELRQGLDVNHREIILTEKAKAGESYNLTLRAFPASSGSTCAWCCTPASWIGMWKNIITM